MEQMEEFSPIEVSELEVLPPVEPTRVVALAKNRTSVDNDPLVFLKTPSSIIGDGDTIKLPAGREKTWAEVELAFIISQTAKDVSAAEADKYIQ
jgi:2-keto-4-pentenoate hydratase/2-oxohepta-3-ene-1,7-dioic acid hydratase in catechol pathway